jgi:hypothetical protein
MRTIMLVLVALTSAARADGWYVSGTFGDTRVNDEISQPGRPSETYRAAALGLRWGHWALQSEVFDSASTERLAVSAFGAGLKYIEAISSHFELYLRGRAMRGVVANGPADDSISGHGLGIGAGIQVKAKLSLWGALPLRPFFTNHAPSLTLAAFVDTGYDFYRLHDPHGHAIDPGLSSIAIGVAVGSDF